MSEKFMRLRVLSYSVSEMFMLFSLLFLRNHVDENLFQVGLNLDHRAQCHAQRTQLIEQRIEGPLIVYRPCQKRLVMFIPAGHSGGQIYKLALYATFEAKLIAIFTDGEEVCQWLICQEFSFRDDRDTVTE